ncbi:hypothetical protein KKF34_01395 [Myxococcota bacterium]|nr:hypothetical protein [Myxococcota bacterium]MBU1380057.1 hypothetical protein [Myxococcota bacterium]MBU1495515.1 hypothetical protein [Myxococcota bacterium]
MKKTLIILILIILYPVLSTASDSEESRSYPDWVKRFTPSLDGLVYGSFNSLGSPLKKGSTKHYHFNGAVNAGGEFQFSKNLYFGAMIHFGNGGDSYGFKTDDGVVVTDLYMRIESVIFKKLNFTIGSFDMPFGEQTEVVTNNASSINNPFLVNSLFYSILSSPTGTLNTVGIMGEFELNHLKITASISNGTGEGAANPEERFASVLKISYNYENKLKFAISGIFSDDRKNDLLYTGLASKLLGGLFDFHWNFHSGKFDFNLRNYISIFRFDDENKITNKEIFYAGMSQIKITWNKKFYLAFRGSFWRPEDTDGDGNNITSSAPCAGYGCVWSESADLIQKDQMVIRYQAALGYYYAKNILFKITAFTDHYQYSSDAFSFVFSGTVNY